MKTRILLALAAMSLFLAFPATTIFAASNYNGLPDAGSVSFPSTTPQSVSGAGASGADTTTFTLESTTTVDIFVGDGYITGDQYQVSLDGSPLFTTTYISQALSGVSTGLDGCTGSADVASNLSWGDATVTLGSGTHTIVVTDISTTISIYPAGYCLILESPPSFGAPQFPLGLSVVLAVAIVGLLIVKKSALPDIKRTV